MSGDEAPTQLDKTLQESQPDDPAPAPVEVIPESAIIPAPVEVMPESAIIPAPVEVMPESGIIPAAAEVMPESGISPAAAEVMPQSGIIPAAADEQEEEEEEVLSYRALVLTGHGGLDKVKLQVKTQKSPQPKAAEVQVRVKACGLNFAELLGRQGLYDLLPAPPFTMGMEASGVIEAVGHEVADRKVGDRVILWSRSGLWQEVVFLPAKKTFLMPESMSFEEGAALPISYLTAYMMLFDMTHLRPGKSVLIHCAAGGVGIAATQLCQTVQDVTIFGTASASKHDIIAQGGVTHPIDYRTKDYVEEIHKISPEGVDIVLDPLGGLDSQKGYDLLKPLGTIISFGAANCVTGTKKNLLAIAKVWFNQLSITTQRLMQNNRAIAGFHLGYICDEELISSCMATLLDLYNQGKIKPRIDSTYHFEEVNDAMSRMHERKNIGKVILLPEPKEEEDKPQSDSEPGDKTEAPIEEEKKEEVTEEETAKQD
ncbi:synaptic vesicle membrane protein VAT-1 homolog [Genypterus blacodes]|uniref:synaptic vesicle membrane protein VAT-1 homolog n=1 Tax=Genypterus blacodes TaxID=154954 RepID=UPI003F76519A